MKKGTLTLDDIDRLYKAVSNSIESKLSPSEFKACEPRLKSWYKKYGKSIRTTDK